MDKINSFAFVDVSKYDSKYSYLLQFTNNIKTENDNRVFQNEHKLVVDTISENYRCSVSHYVCINTDNILNKKCEFKIKYYDVNNISQDDPKRNIYIGSNNVLKSQSFPFNKLYIFEIIYKLLNDFIDYIQIFINHFKNHIYVVKPDNTIEKYDSNKPFCSYRTSILLLDNKIKYGNLLELLVNMIDKYDIKQYIKHEIPLDPLVNNGPLATGDIQYYIDEYINDYINYIKYNYDYYDMNNEEFEQLEINDDKSEQLIKKLELQNEQFKQFKWRIEELEKQIKTNENEQINQLKIQIEELREKNEELKQINKTNQLKEVERLNKIIDKLLN